MFDTALVLLIGLAGGGEKANRPQQIDTFSHFWKNGEKRTSWQK